MGQPGLRRGPHARPGASGRRGCGICRHAGSRAILWRGGRAHQWSRDPPQPALPHARSAQEMAGGRTPLSGVAASLTSGSAGQPSGAAGSAAATSSQSSPEVSAQPRPPAWKGAERALALELSLRRGLLDAVDPTLIDLSQALNALARHEPTRGLPGSRRGGHETGQLRRCGPKRGGTRADPVRRGRPVRWEARRGRPCPARRPPPFVLHCTTAGASWLILIERAQRG